MIQLTMRADDVASLRFAVSPLWEVVASLRMLVTRRVPAIHTSWVREVPPTLADDPGLGLLRDLVSSETDLLPGFLAPTPAGPSPELEDELRDLTATRGAALVADIEAVFGTAPPERVQGLVDHQEQELLQLADQVRRYWEVALAPSWERIRTVLRFDIAYRGMRLTDGGARLLFEDLHPTISFADDTITIPETRVERSHPLEGRGLVLVPSVFAWPRPFVKAAAPWSPVLRYPARGVADLWADGAGSPSDLAAVLGRTRALLLEALDRPTSTTDLAARTQLAVSGVSVHLAKLRAAGLVESRRTGRVVLYTRTTRAEALLSGRDAGNGR